jgi:hypothetical protein
MQDQKVGEVSAQAISLTLGRCLGRRIAATIPTSFP